MGLRSACRPRSRLLVQKFRDIDITPIRDQGIDCRHAGGVALLDLISRAIDASALKHAACFLLRPLDLFEAQVEWLPGFRVDKSWHGMSNRVRGSE